MERYERRSDLQHGAKQICELIKLGNISQNPTSQLGCTYYVGGISPTICAGTHGYCIGHILVKGSKNKQCSEYTENQKGE